MNGAALLVGDADLREAIQQEMPAALGVESPIVRLLRRPMPYRSSFALEDLEVEFEDGSTVRAVFKDLSPGGLLPDGRRAKLDFMYDPAREIEAYRRILPEIVGTPRFYGAWIDAQRDRWWLFLERLHGVPLTEVGGGRMWREAARWLARMHRTFDGQTHRLARAVPLIWHDSEYYSRWVGRCRSVLDRAGHTAEAKAGFDRLAAGYEGLIARLTDLPMTFLHGEFFPSNVLIDGGGPSVRVSPVDWEMAAIGPGAVDLAALVGGQWSEEERLSMALAYREELRGRGPSSGEREFLETLDLCRLHLAIQRLGWSADWSPPPEHAHDWLGDAFNLAERLGLL